MRSLSKQDRFRLRNVATKAGGNPDSPPPKEPTCAFSSLGLVGVRVANKPVIKAGGMDESSVLKWGLRNASDLREWDDRITILEEYPMFKYVKKGLSLKGKIRTIESDRLKIMSIVHLRFSE